eukprot:TRINITY_DN1721_c0_g1_i1.p1 TRINITY_DN1721_c0_g1~~TRINITY_DN1721_c0_g1_i1.p1  ORF type:complete len:138 (-),score=50.23 TRINITY_DN1721_c0_g1_i1:238-612(-)
MELPILRDNAVSVETGPVRLISRAVELHPVDHFQQSVKSQDPETKRQGLAMVFGSAFPAQLAHEEAAFSRPLRLPGLKSERIAWEILTGNDVDIGVEDYLSLPENSEKMLPDVHSMMETRLRMN